MRISALSILLFFGIWTLLFSQNVAPQLLLSANDVRVEDAPSGDGLLIYVKDKPGLGSVMLTESAENPDQLDINTYALRTSEYNRYNSDERRTLNGQFIQLKDGYFIVDSSPVFDDIFIGDAFILFLPFQVSYGYETTRNGTIDFTKETDFINIRTFVKPHADYTGEYADNSFFVKKINIAEEPPFVLAIEDIPIFEAAEPIEDDSIAEVESLPVEEVEQEAVEEVAAKSTIVDDIFFQDLSRFSEETINAFNEIAEQVSSRAVFIQSSRDIPTTIVSILKNLSPENTVDVVIVFDTTRSMWDDISSIKSSLVPLLKSSMVGRTYRIGLVFYKDKREEYEIRKFDFTEKLQVLQLNLQTIQATGGDDWAESVHEALQEAVENFTWLADERVIFLIGDAPPHEPPRNNLDVNKIYRGVKNKEIKLVPFIVPVR